MVIVKLDVLIIYDYFPSSKEKKLKWWCFPGQLEYSSNFREHIQHKLLEQLCPRSKESLKRYLDIIDERSSRLSQ